MHDAYDVTSLKLQLNVILAGRSLIITNQKDQNVTNLYRSLLRNFTLGICTWYMKPQGTLPCITLSKKCVGT